MKVLRVASKPPQPREDFKGGKDTGRIRHRSPEPLATLLENYGGSSTEAVCHWDGIFCPGLHLWTGGLLRGPHVQPGPSLHL